MEAILSTWGRTLRFISILILLVLSSTLMMKRYFDSSELSLEFDDSRTIVKVKNNGQLLTQSLLAASDCWVNTGIKIDKGQTYKIKVTGRIHTAADYLLKAVAKDTIPLFEWSGAEGRIFRIRSDRLYQKFDQFRRASLIEPTANMGAVLFYFKEEHQKEPSCKGGINFLPRPSKLRVYNPGETKEFIEGKNDTNSKVEIWASVNDMLIMDHTERSKLAYLGADLNGEQLKEKLSKWENIKASDYRRLWFDDNIGNYIISVEIRD